MEKIKVFQRAEKTAEDLETEFKDELQDLLKKYYDLGMTWAWQNGAIALAVSEVEY